MSEDFPARLRRILERIGDLTWTGGLHRDLEFRELHGEPRSWVEAALRLLADADAGEQEKTIAVLAMQGLPLPELVRFAGQALELLEEGRTSERVFERAAFPTYDWNTRLVEAFDTPEVQDFLRRVLASPAVSAQRKRIVQDEILSGNARKDVQELREAGEIG